MMSARFVPTPAQLHPGGSTGECCNQGVCVGGGVGGGAERERDERGGWGRGWGVEGGRTRQL